ncbi:MAG: ERF family protein [Pyrinomonadaceae bacterium]
MKKSESICDLAKALAQVQASLVPAKRDSTNPYFNSTYADLSSVWESCRETLAKNGLCVIQGNSVGAEKTLIVETILIHESGQWVQSELCLPLSKADPQGVGSAMTYGRRYGLAAIVGIVADADDDGNAASSKNGDAKGIPTRPNERHVNGNHRPVPGNPPPRASISVS